MTTNGKPLGQYIQQIAGITDPCPACGEHALVARIEILLRPAYIHTGKGQPPQGRPVLAHVLCFHCGAHDVLRWDDKGQVTADSAKGEKPAA